MAEVSKRSEVVCANNMNLSYAQIDSFPDNLTKYVPSYTNHIAWRAS